jgi:hypothetical protein
VVGGKSKLATFGGDRPEHLLPKPLADYAAVLFPVDTAELYFFNTSGWTLIPGNQDLYVDGKLLASLPRLTYTVFRVRPGMYDLRLHNMQWPGRMLALKAEAGKTYFVEVGYRPELWPPQRSGQDTVQFREIEEYEATRLMRQLTAR